MFSLVLVIACFVHYGAAACGSQEKAYGGNCYKYYNTHKSWSSAADTCYANGFSIASVLSQDENDFVQGLSHSQLQEGNGSPGTCFKAPKNLDIVGVWGDVTGMGGELLSGKTLSECKDICQNPFSYGYKMTCNSFLYKTNQCLLLSLTENSVRTFDHPDVYIQHEGSSDYQYYENSCNQGLNCFEGEDGMTLMGIADHVLTGVESLEACQELCVEKWDLCASLLYYSNGGWCIMNTDTKATAATSYAAQDGAQYRERIGCGTQNCFGAKLDLALVVDGSGSIGAENFVLVKNFAASLIAGLDIGTTQVAMVQFSKDPKREFDLNSHSSKQAAAEAARSISWLRGGTYIKKALEFTQDNILVESRGKRPDATQAVIVFTDGKSTDDPSYVAQDLRNAGVQVFVVGITDNVDNEQLLAIAGSQDRVLKIDNFDELNTQFTQLLSQKICSSPGMWIGYSRYVQDYEWEDYSPIGFENFNNIATYDKDCVLMEADGEWRDEDCGEKRSFVCKRKA